MKTILHTLILTGLVLSCSQNTNPSHNPESDYPYKWKEKEIEKYYNSIYLSGKLTGFSEKDASAYAACKQLML